MLCYVFVYWVGFVLLEHSFLLSLYLCVLMAGALGQGFYFHFPFGATSINSMLVYILTSFYFRFHFDLAA